MQHSRIRNKWTRIEQQILEDYFDAGKKVLEFWNSQEALEDPKPENKGIGPKIHFRGKDGNEFFLLKNLLFIS